MKQKMILVTGWSYPPESLRHLGDAMAEECEVESLNNSALIAKSNLASLFPCSAYARGLIAIMDQLTEPCWLGGWSMGGMIALEAAAQMPRFVKGLILISTTAKFCSDDGYAAGVPISTIQSMARRFKKDHRTTLRQFYSLAARPYGPDVTFMPEWSETMQNGLTYLEKADLRKVAQQVDLPTLVLHGLDDAVIPPEGGQYLAKLLKNGSFVSYYGVGHDLPHRRTKVVGEEILKFIRAHP
jgi:pimeloyl-[acyl-carrier protein] methyl ester esterase